MPFTVVTLSKAPPSLRGDLSKWMQEIAPGVYVGNFNSRIREELWIRVIESVKTGEATMSFSFGNEIGYHFVTHNTDSIVIEYDGIPLVMYPLIDSEKDMSKSTGFSDAYKRRAAKRFSSKPETIKKIDAGEVKWKGSHGKPYAVIDIETDGLDNDTNRILEIGAVKVEHGLITKFRSLIKYEGEVPKEISVLNGITSELLNVEGISEKEAIAGLIAFIGDLDLVGYNIGFDIGFINRALEKLQKESIKNNLIDLLKYVKKEKMFLDDFKLQTVLNDYGINEVVPHRALEDAKLIFDLSCKLTKFQSLMK